MKIKFFIPVVLVITIILVSCAGPRQYLAPDLSSKNIKTIAILPVEMQFTGTLPKGMTPEMKQEVEESESRGFQQFLYSNILRFEGKKKKIKGIQFQSLEQTLSILKENNINYTDSWSKTPEDMAKLLGVDAVVKMSVVKQRFMSDLASLGLGVLKNVFIFSAKTNPIYASNVPTKTGDIMANCSLIFQGNTLWNIKYQQETNWNNGAQDVINTITRKMGRRFPL